LRIFAAGASMIAGVEEEKEEPSVVFDVCYYFSLARSLARWLIAWPAAANGVIIRLFHGAVADILSVEDTRLNKRWIRGGPTTIP
jgi:hypothetical protein